MFTEEIKIKSIFGPTFLKLKFIYIIKENNYLITKSW